MKSVDLHLFGLTAFLVSNLAAPVGLDYMSFFTVWIWPLLSGIITSLVTVALLYKFQQPKLAITIADDKYDPKSDAHYVHLKVKNVSKPFLGGGTAVNCRGKISLQDGRSFITKWAMRPSPETIQVVNVEGELKVIRTVAPVYLEQAKYEYLRPGDEKSLDVAVRFKGESSCYIHEPENFLDQNYRPKKNKLLAGTHPFTVVLEYDGGRSHEFRFKIVNKEGDSPGLLSLEV